MVGLDVTLRCALSAAHVQRIRDHGSASTALLAELTATWQEDSGRLPILHDPLAVAVSFDPTLVTTQPRQVTVVTSSEARGTTLAVDSPTPNAQVCFDVDAARFIDLFMTRILNASPQRDPRRPAR
jgi:inosine-uridine nucleoside N-ribohydrolase